MQILAVYVCAVNRPLPLYAVSENVLLSLYCVSIHVASSTRSPCFSTINTTRKATVAYPTVKLLLFHMLYAIHLQKLLKSHEMV